MTNESTGRDLTHRACVLCGTVVVAMPDELFTTCGGGCEPVTPNLEALEESQRDNPLSLVGE